MNGHKFSEIIGCIVILLFIGLAVYIAFPYKPYETFNSPYPVLNSPVQRGDPVHYQIEFCKYSNTPATISKWLVNDEVIHFPSTESNTGVGCRNATISLKIPEYATPGYYEVHTMLSYHVNYFRDINYKHKTEKFEVIE